MEKCDAALHINREYEFFHYIGINDKCFPRIDPNTALEHTVYVDRKRFDRDVAIGQETMFMAYAQFQKDVTRCRFVMNGRSTSRLPINLPSSLLRYCTQSAMGLPLEILHRSGYLVAEMLKKEPMLVVASDRDVKVEKTLRCSMRQPALWLQIAVSVCVSNFEQTATISYRFSDMIDPDTLADECIS